MMRSKYIFDCFLVVGFLLLGIFGAANAQGAFGSEIAATQYKLTPGWTNAAVNYSDECYITTGGNDSLRSLINDNCQGNTRQCSTLYRRIIGGKESVDDKNILRETYHEYCNSAYYGPGYSRLNPQ